MFRFHKLEMLHIRRFAFSKLKDQSRCRGIHFTDEVMLKVFHVAS